MVLVVVVAVAMQIHNRNNELVVLVVVTQLLPLIAVVATVAVYRNVYHMSHVTLFIVPCQNSVGVTFFQQLRLEHCCSLTPQNNTSETLQMNQPRLK